MKIAWRPSTFSDNGRLAVTRSLTALPNVSEFSSTTFRRFVALTLPLSSRRRRSGSASTKLSENVLGLQAIFILYPYLVQGSFSVLDAKQEGGETVYNAAFGLQLTGGIPPAHVCSYIEDGGEASGYRQRREEAIISDREFDTNLDCKVDPNDIVRQASKTVLNRSSVTSDSGSYAAQGPTASGKDSWKWLLLGPATR